MLKSAAVILVLAFVGAAPAHAYQLGDHKRITLEAVREFDHCFPGLVSESDQTLLWMSDLDEDVDILRKDFLYSHYFNPYKHLNMWRLDSSVRVRRLQAALLEDAQDGNYDGFMIFAHLGHAIHHLQDMTVPAHVVPVVHWLNDGFEKYDYQGDISSGLSCADLVSQAPDLETLLVSTAERTLARVENFHVSLFRNGRSADVSGYAFWRPSSNSDFGSYGSLGNHFGDASFTEASASYRVPNAARIYAGFKQQQMKLAVRASVRALYWYLVAMNH